MSKSSQTPQLDDRFYQSSLLNKPIFSLLDSDSSTAAGKNKMRIVVKVTDDKGVPITDAAFGVFNAGADLEKGNLRQSDLIMLGRTDKRGLFDSGSQTLEPGSYQIKVVKTGYEAFVQVMRIIPKRNNMQVFVFKLVKE